MIMLHPSPLLLNAALQLCPFTSPSRSLPKSPPRTVSSSLHTITRQILFVNGRLRAPLGSSRRLAPTGCARGARGLSCFVWLWCGGLYEGAHFPLQVRLLEALLVAHAVLLEQGLELLHTQPLHLAETGKRL